MKTFGMHVKKGGGWGVVLLLAMTAQSGRSDSGGLIFGNTNIFRQWHGPAGGSGRRHAPDS